ncbi:hypothetical protein [Methylobacterium nigriterrae]|uniref:hypothetical protein n=1 Tax=Methylobacterium nigriterrae TaxID=3127512 RepID=UPI00301330FC
MSETPLAVAIRHVAEAEQRRDQQIALVAELADRGEDRAAAEDMLREIKQTLRLARAQQALLRVLGD